MLKNDFYTVKLGNVLKSILADLQIFQILISNLLEQMKNFIRKLSIVEIYDTFSNRHKHANNMQIR